MWIFFFSNLLHYLMCIYAFILNTYFESTLQHHKTLTNVNAEDDLQPPPPPPPPPPKKKEKEKNPAKLALIIYFNYYYYFKVL